MTFLKSSTISLFLMLAATFPGAQAATMREMHEFIEHMKESEKRNGPIRMSKPSLAKFLAKSEQIRNLKGSSHEPRVSKEELEKQLNYYSNYPLFAKEKKEGLDEENAERNLNYGQYNNGGNYNRNYNGNGQRNYANGNGGYNAANGGAYNGNNGGAQNQGNGWRWWWNNQNPQDNMTEAWQMYDNQDNATYNLNNLADLSLKYAGCSSVTSFVGVEDDNEESSGFASNALVQYRFCPAESCDDGSWNGCTSEYGEYMMSLQDFLQVQVEFKEEQFKSLCEYCNQCYDYNDSGYCDGENCCSHTGDCEEYKQTCEGKEDEEDAPPDYEDLFECMQVEVSEDDRRRLNWYNGQPNNYNRYNNGYNNGGQGGSWWGWGNNNNNQYNNYNPNAGYGYDEQEDDNVAYLGIHCNGQNMQLGLFSDNTCSILIGSEDTINVTELTGVDFNTEELEAYFVPQGCLACGGEEYNVSADIYSMR